MRRHFAYAFVAPNRQRAAVKPRHHGSASHVLIIPSERRAVCLDQLLGVLVMVPFARRFPYIRKEGRRVKARPRVTRLGITLLRRHVELASFQLIIEL